MRLLITGANGQVGWELQRACQPLGEVIGLDRTHLDLADIGALRKTIREFRPDVILNSAAYTAVDAAEANEKQANLINGDAVGVMADECARLGALMIHYSTDYVFDGEKSTPYAEQDASSPLNTYGRSKRAGEIALQHSRADWLCLRTSWVYSNRGKNFLLTILRLAQKSEELRIVNDQFGAPTWARTLADVSAHIVSTALRERREGAFSSSFVHASAGGRTTWHGFASAIIDIARNSAPDNPLLAKRIQPIASIEYPLPARRPQNSLLSNALLNTRFGLEIPDWHVGLTLCMATA